MPRALLAAAWLAALVGCYDTPRPPCAFSCGPSDECPDGYSCRADSWCRRDDVADSFACAPPGSPDASAADAAQPPDAGDRLDADRPDAGDPPDSAVIDGPVPDAPPADDSVFTGD